MVYILQKIMHKRTSCRVGHMICLLWHRISMPSRLIEARLFYFFHEIKMNLMIYWEIFLRYSLIFNRNFQFIDPQLVHFPEIPGPPFGALAWEIPGSLVMSRSRAPNRPCCSSVPLSTAQGRVLRRKSTCTDDLYELWSILMVNNH